MLCELQKSTFHWFTDNTQNHFARIKQRVVLANSISEELFLKIGREYIESGRMSTLWNEIKAVHSKFVELYTYISPLVMYRYWKDEYKDISKVHFAEKRFDEFKQLYIETYETLCKMLVIVVGVELIIHNRNLEIPTKKGSMSLWDFEKMPNGKKPEIIKNYPIADLFIESLDNKLRNGIGHNSAHYNLSSDDIVYYEFKGNSNIERTVKYTDFVDRVLRLFSVFELGVNYYNLIYLESIE